MNPYGLVIAAVTTLVSLYVKWAKSSNDAALAQKQLNEVEEEADRNTRDETTRIEQLKKTIEDETVSIKNRRKAIEELQQIVPAYHASISEEYRLYGRNIQI